MKSPKHIAWIIFAMNVILISSIDIYMPAAPYLSHVFGVSDSIMKLTFMASPFLSSLAGIPFGRYSDKIGRKPFILAGLALYILGSLLCTIAPGIEIFFAGRCIQALGTGGLSVLSGAILADIFTGVTLARYMGIFASIYPIVFALAPILGAEILTYLGWRYIFSTNLIAMVLMAGFIWASIPETNDRTQADTQPAQDISDMKTLLFSGATFLLVMIHAIPICFNGIFAVNSPFIYIDTFMMSPREFSYIQAIPVSAQFMGAYIYKSIVEQIGITNSFKIGFITTCVFIIVAGLMASGFIEPDPYLIIGIISIFSLGATFMISSGATLILDKNPGNKGLTMSYISLMRNLAISIIVGTVSSIHYETMTPIIYSLIGTALLQTALISRQIRKI